MDIPRTRDVIVLAKDLTYPVRVHADMVQSGWAGGQGTVWADAGFDTFLVNFSDGGPGGFMLW